MSNPFYNLRGGIPPRYSLVETAPVEEPITLNEAKIQCEVESDEHYWDDYLTLLIVAARRCFEKWSGRWLVTRNVQFIFDNFPYPTYEIYLPKGPIQSVTSLQYLDPNGTLTTFPQTTKWLADVNSYRPKVYLAWAQIWPMQRYIENAITITCVAGYGLHSTQLPQDVPAEYQIAIKLIVAHWFKHRTPIVEDSSIQELPYHLRQIVMEDRLACL